MVDYGARGACEACEAAVMGSAEVFVEIECLNLQTGDGGIECIVVYVVSTSNKVEG